MATVRVKARVDGPDSNGHPRSTGEIFDCEVARARNLARDGFVELIDDNGQGLPWDAVLAADSAPVAEAPVAVPTPDRRKKKS